MGKYGLSVIECDATKHGQCRDGKGRPFTQQTVANDTDVAVRLFCEDGTQFNEPPPVPALSSGEDDGGGTVDISATTVTESTDITALPDNTPPLCIKAPPPGQLYNRILVDAECTHDGSLKHIAKFASQWGWSTFERRVPWLAPEKIAQVTGLQRALLWNGFRLLEPCPGPPSSAVASSLVYSTCSLSRSQNEDIVSWLLSVAPTARVVPIDQDACRIRLYGMSDGGKIDAGADDGDDADLRASYFCSFVLLLTMPPKQLLICLRVRAQLLGLARNLAFWRTRCASIRTAPTRAGCS